MSNLDLKKIKYQLEILGYWAAEKSLNNTELKALIDELGSVSRSADIKIQDEVDGPIHTNMSMPFHVDGFNEDFLLWFAIDGADDFEPTCLLDSKEILGLLNEEEMRVLSSIEVVRGELKTSLVTPNRFNYLPFMVDYEGLNIVQKKVYQRLHAVMRQVRDTSIIEVHLQPGYVLLIDNRRMVHGRRKLLHHSKRNLLRLWIQRHEK